MNQDLISIIIPVYNVEKYMDKCIESVVNQTYKNLEIILIDDGSTDKSGLICDKWAEKDIRITVIHKSNEGVSNARNIGLEKAKGSYIGFVDSDDYIKENMYEILMNKMLDTKSDMCFCNFLYVNDNGIIRQSKLSYNDNNDKKIIMRRMFENNNENFAVWNKLIKKECLENVKFEESIKIYEDALFNFECLDKIEKVIFVKDYLYFYVERENSTLHEFNIKKQITILDAMIKINRILEKNNIKERFFRQADFICRVYLYEDIAQKENLDFTEYKKIAKQYLAEGLLKQKIGLKNQLKVIGAVYFTNQYLKLKSLRKKGNKQ